MVDRELSTGETEVLGALHRQTDGRQWQQVLEVAFREDLANARAFAGALLHSASQDPASGQRAMSLLELLPSVIRFSTERRLLDLQRRGTPLLGRADLMLRSGGRYDWSVVVELKLKTGYGTRQLERYLEFGAPVSSVVGARQPAVAPEVTGHEGWLGEALWRDLLPALQAFSWPRGGLELLEGKRAVWDDPPSYEFELGRERDLVARLRKPLPSIRCSNESSV